MKCVVKMTGIFCESAVGGLAKLKGSITVRQLRRYSPPSEVSSIEYYSTLRGHQFSTDGDLRPVALAVGDELAIGRNVEFNLQAPFGDFQPGDLIEIRGNLLGAFQTLSIPIEEIANLLQPRSVTFRLAGGGNSVRAQFKVAKATA